MSHHIWDRETNGPWTVAYRGEKDGIIHYPEDPSSALLKVEGKRDYGCDLVLGDGLICLDGDGLLTGG